MVLLYTLKYCVWPVDSSHKPSNSFNSPYICCSSPDNRSSNFHFKGDMLILPISTELFARVVSQTQKNWPTCNPVQNVQNRHLLRMKLPDCYVLKTRSYLYHCRYAKNLVIPRPVLNVTLCTLADHQMMAMDAHVVPPTRVVWVSYHSCALLSTAHL